MNKYLLCAAFSLSLASRLSAVEVGTAAEFAAALAGTDPITLIPLAEFGGELKVHHNTFYGKDRKGKDTGLFGEDAIYVPREFVDEAKRDYTPRADSPAMKHGIPLQCVPADINGKLYPTGPRPCGAYAG